MLRTYQSGATMWRIHEAHTQPTHNQPKYVLLCPPLFICVMFFASTLLIWSCCLFFLLLRMMKKKRHNTKRLNTLQKKHATNTQRTISNIIYLICSLCTAFPCACASTQEHKQSYKDIMLNICTQFCPFAASTPVQAPRESSNGQAPHVRHTVAPLS